MPGTCSKVIAPWKQSSSGFSEIASKFRQVIYGNRFFGGCGCLEGLLATESPRISPEAPAVSWLVGNFIGELGGRPQNIK